jgi:hypothetical protein
MIRSEFVRYWPLIVCHIIIAPFLLRASSLMGGVTSIQLSGSKIVDDFMILDTMSWVFAATLLAGAYIHLRRSDSNEPSRTRWLLWVSPVGLALYPLIEMPDHNEYKILLLWSLPMGLAIVLGLAEFSRERSRVLRSFVLGSLLTVGIGCISVNAFVRAHKDMGRSNPWVFSGSATRTALTTKYARMSQEMIDWVVANTSATDFFLVESERWDRNSFSLLSQRRIVAGGESIQTERLPNYPELFQINLLLLTRIRQEKGWWVSGEDSLTRSLFEIAGDKQSYYAVVDKHVTTWWPEHTSIVFQNNRFVVLTAKPTNFVASG